MTTSVDPSIKKNEASIYIIKSRDGNDHQQDWRHGLINFNEVNLTHCMHASAMCDVMETQHKALATASQSSESHTIQSACCLHHVGEVTAVVK